MNGTDEQGRGQDIQGSLRYRGIRAITLDLDDTLWPVEPVLAYANGQLVEWLRPRAPGTAAVVAANPSVLHMKGRYPEHAHDMSWLRTQLLRETLTAQQEDPALAEPAFAVFLDARQQVTPWPDVEPVLAQWASRYRIAAITNGNADIHRTPLGRYFHASISAPAFGAAKPDPRIFREAARVLGVEPAACLHIGDDLALDVQGAREAGLSALWLVRPELGRASVAKITSGSGLVHNYLHDLWCIDKILQPLSVVE